MHNCICIAANFYFVNKFPASRLHSAVPSHHCLTMFALITKRSPKPVEHTSFGTLHFQATAAPVGDDVTLKRFDFGLCSHRNVLRPNMKSLK